jgi:hypothetical protein
MPVQEINKLKPIPTTPSMLFKMERSWPRVETWMMLPWDWVIIWEMGLDGGVLEPCSFPDDHDDGCAQGWILLLH